MITILICGLAENDRAVSSSVLVLVPVSSRAWLHIAAWFFRLSCGLLEPAHHDPEATHRANVNECGWMQKTSHGHVYECEHVHA